MKYTILLAAALIAACAADSVDLETVIAIENDDEVVSFESPGEGDGSGSNVTFPLTDEETIVIVKDDEWEADGHEWDPYGEDTREGSGGAVFEAGDPAVESKFQLSLATEHRRGGGARGKARGRGNNRKRSLEALRGSRK